MIFKKPRKQVLLVKIGPVVALLSPILCLAAGLFDYARPALDIREVGVAQHDSIPVHDITFAGLTGRRTAAYLVTPTISGKHPGVLFVHWYESKSPTSNRTQFLNEAVTLAKQGVVSLLIETMWSNPEWFPTRNPKDDYANSLQQVKDLRRALDVLLAQPSIDPKRIVYVGHDFGAMYGATMSGVDHRVKAYALQAGTPVYSNWYLLGSKAQGAERQRIIDELAPLDPARWLPKAGKNVPVFLQFGRTDPYVPAAQAQAFADAVRGPKTVKFYDAGHELNEQAVQDRVAWVRDQLRLGQ